VGLFELLILIVILLLVFGGSKLPAIGDALGRTIKSFRKAARPDKPKPRETPEKD